MRTLIFLLVVFMLHTACGMNKDDSANKEVQKAYELRINGQVDEALGLLEDLLVNDPTNAMAHYEMARIQDYMLTGGGDISVDDILSSINKALEYDPENASYAYFKANLTFLKAYMSMRGESEDVAGKVAEACKAYEDVLKLQKDYKEAMLCLVEIYGWLPEDMGGDVAKAEMYTEKLEALDDFYGAKARLVLLPEDTDPINYWTEYLSNHKKDVDILTELSRACLLMGNIEMAEKYINETILIDPSQNVLVLNLARYHLMQVMQNQEVADTELPLAKEYFEKFINSDPAPIAPLKAYAIGWVSRIEQFSGNEEEAKRLTEKAKSLDPYFSRATGVPSASLFIPPDEPNHTFSSFFTFY